VPTSTLAPVLAARIDVVLSGTADTRGLRHDGSDHIVVQSARLTLIDEAPARTAPRGVSRRSSSLGLRHRSAALEGDRGVGAGVSLAAARRRRLLVGHGAGR
jgi:hypothetical protein